MAAILLAGIVSYFQLPVSALPQVDYPTIQVVTLYPGASPDIMASTVTAPLERQFGQMQGLSQMTSTSSGGVSVIVLQFALSLNIDVAEQEVQSIIAKARLQAEEEARSLLNPSDTDEECGRILDQLAEKLGRTEKFAKMNHDRAVDYALARVIGMEPR